MLLRTSLLGLPVSPLLFHWLVKATDLDFLLLMKGNIKDTLRKMGKISHFTH